MLCQYCKKEFKTSNYLVKHQKTAKFCLKIQNGTIENDKNECTFCKKTFANKGNLNIHISICKEKQKKDTVDVIIANKENELNSLLEKHEKELSKKDEDIKQIIYKYETELNLIKKDKDLIIEKLEFIKKKNDEQIKDQKEQIKELQDKLERLGNKAIDRVGNTTNTTNFNMQLNNYMSQENIDKKIANKFNEKYILNGIEGVAKFVYDHIAQLEDGSLVYGCYDVSRKIFKYKDDAGREIKDIKAKKLVSMIQPGLMKQTKILHSFFNDEYDYLEKIKDQKDLSNEDIKDLHKMKFYKDKAEEVGNEIIEMHKTNKFSNELANLASC